MSIKTVELKGRDAQSSRTEMLFEIASAKAEGIGLIRFNISSLSGESEKSSLKRIISALTKELKQMKTKGKLQLYATPASFENGTTEAVFLLNKYPCISDNTEVSSEYESYIYVKI